MHFFPLNSLNNCFQSIKRGRRSKEPKNNLHNLNIGEEVGGFHSFLIFAVNPAREANSHVCKVIVHCANQLSRVQGDCRLRKPIVGCAGRLLRVQSKSFRFRW